MTDTATMEYSELLKEHDERVKKYEDEFKHGRDKINKMLNDFSRNAEKDASIIAIEFGHQQANIYMDAVESARAQMYKDGMEVIEGIYNRSMATENLIMFGITELYGAN